MRGNETPGRIVTNFCTGVGVHDVITCANFYDCRCGVWACGGVKFWVYPFICIVALTTLSHYRASVWYLQCAYHGCDWQPLIAFNTSSSAVAKRPLDASCPSVSFVASIVQYIERSFLLLVTSASDLLVRTIRFCSVVFGITSSLAVIHTIRGRQWLCIVRKRAWSVSRCKTTATVTGYRAWRLVVKYLHTRSMSLWPAICVITCGTVAVVHRRLCWQHLACCSVNSRQKPDIGSESQFLPTPPAFDAPDRRFPSEYRHPVWCVKTRMVWLPDGEKILKISLFVLTECTNVTDIHRHCMTI